MADYSENTYGERIAGVYDLWYSEVDKAAIDVLFKLSRGGRVLELGIGTGRIALPLSRTGVAVEGIDASEAMVARLHSKPGGKNIPVSMGNFAEVAVEGEYSLIYVVFNTFFALLTQGEQVRCFQKVARHLTSDGAFVIEAFVPDLTRFTGGQATRTVKIDDHCVQMDVSQLELDKQLISSQHVVFTRQETQFYPVKLRYAWPSEMDLMAKLSRLKLKERWSDWKKSPFTATSGKHISIYERGR